MGHTPNESIPLSDSWSKLSPSQNLRFRFLGRAWTV